MVLGMHILIIMRPRLCDATIGFAPKGSEAQEMPDGDQDVIGQLRGRIIELEALVTELEARLSTATNKASRLDQLRNADGDRLFVLENEAAKLREQLRKIADENESLRSVFRSDHYAGPGQICVRPNLPARHLGLQGNHGFLIMPFGPKWSSDVEQAVSQALSQVGMQCHRADQLSGRDIMLDVWCWICECGVVIADVTDCNSNVMYELGLAEALGKRIILISQTGDPQRLAFDLLGLRLIVYSPEEGRLQDLTAGLCKALKTTVSKTPRGEMGISNG